MSLLKKILLIFSISLLTVTTAIADDDYWPFPLGEECPFAWNFVSESDWKIELNGNKENISFYVAETNDGDVRVTTVIYDDDWKLLAHGTEIFDESSFILNLRLKNFKDDTEFSMILRLYDNASKVTPGNAIDYFPNYGKRNSCQNLYETTLAATVLNECDAPECASDSMDHQALEKKQP